MKAPKSFRHFSQRADGQFVARAPQKPWPLYDRKAIQKAWKDDHGLIVVEVEKDVLALSDYGFCATTSPGGANNAMYADWTPLSGLPNVVIWPDNDDAGKRYKDDVITMLNQLQQPPKQIMVVDSAKLGLESGGDVSDFIAKEEQKPKTDLLHDVREVIIEKLKEAVSVRDGNLAEFQKLLNTPKHHFSLPFPMLMAASHLLEQGNISIISGDAGSGKSNFILQTILHLQSKGFVVEYLALERDKPFYGTRALAMLAGNNKILDLTARQQTPEVYKEALPCYSAVWERYYEAVTVATGWNVKEVADWVRRNAERGVDISIIDPITAIKTGTYSYKDHDDFMAEIGNIRTVHDHTILLLTHPRVGKGRLKAPHMEDMAGGACFNRFADVVLHLKSYEQPKVAWIQTVNGVVLDPMYIDREITVLKRRSAPAGANHIGFIWENNTFNFNEIGYILNKRVTEKHR